MLNRNRVEIIGHVGKVEVKETSGKKHAIINIATTERWTKDGEKKERTDWHRFVTFAPRLVGLVEKYVSKGDYLSLVGKLRNGQFERDGETVYTVELHISEIGFLQPSEAGTDTTDDEVAA